MIETFELKLPSGETAKFSIWKSAFKKETAYFAKIIDVKKVSAKNTYGVIVKAGQKTVYYADHMKLKSDLIAFYGV
ncbi:hypothetical protein CNR22_03410 [Sphingobacteriaceae bacterium]|nr:hypothetical protein CNR22_03410 [Sphingobacteriaceae bacterium]